MTTEGSTTPPVLQTLPSRGLSPCCSATWMPEKVAMLMAKGPGVLSAMPTKSVNCSAVIHAWRSMSSCWMSGIMA